MKKSNDVDAIVKDLIGLVEEMPEGSWTTTVSLLKLTDYDFSITDSILIEIHRALFSAAVDRGIMLDVSSCDGKDEGFPFNLNFQIFNGNKKAAGEKKIRCISVMTSSGYGPVNYAYNDVMTIRPYSISYECKPFSAQSKIVHRKWSYKTNERKFRALFEKLSKEVKKILETKDETFICDVGECTFFVTYADGLRRSRDFDFAGDIFEDCFAIIREMLPQPEDLPEFLRDEDKEF